jgi:hypothetical protein
MTSGAIARIRTTATGTWASVGILTLALGLTVAVSWFVVGGSAAYRGPIPVLRELWLPLFGLEALLAAGCGFGFVSWLRERSWRRLVGLVIAAWVGEFLVLLFGGTIFANELVPGVAWFYWLIGTGGPVQPIAAVLGGLVAMRLRR